MHVSWSSQAVAAKQWHEVGMQGPDSNAGLDSEHLLLRRSRRKLISAPLMDQGMAGRQASTSGSNSLSFTLSICSSACTRAGRSRTWQPCPEQCPGMLPHCAHLLLCPAHSPSAALPMYQDASSVLVCKAVIYSTRHEGCSWFYCCACCGRRPAMEHQKTTPCSREHGRLAHDRFICTGASRRP